jgi:hypothetical protein
VSPVTALVHLSGSLMDRTVLKNAVRAREVAYVKATTGDKGLPELLNSLESAFVIDLSYVGADGLKRISEGLLNKDNVIFYCSHVDKELISQAHFFGFEVYPRSKFFTSIDTFLNEIGLP